MNPIQNLVLTNLFLLLVYLAYRSFYYKSRKFQANRFFLISGVAVSLGIPWIHLELPGVFLAGSPDINSWIREISGLFSSYSLDPVIINSTIKSEAGFEFWLRFSYLVVTGLLLASLITHLVILWFLASRGKTVKIGRLRVIILKKRWTVFSFFRTVFFPSPFDPFSLQTQMILRHEQVHARQWHSLDNLFMELVRILFFYNPAVYLLSREIKLTHEYIADQESGKSDPYTYSSVLISHQFKVPGFIPVNYFSKKSILKRRLVMLMKNKHNRNAGWKYLLLLPIFGGMLWINACSDKQESLDKQDKSPLQNQVPNLVISEPAQAQESLVQGQVFLIVEQMPQFENGGIEEFRNWIQKNIKYPAIAMENGIQGTVFVSFIVTDKGKIADSKIIRSVDPALDNEVVKALQSAPDWTPGYQQKKPVNVAFSIPVKFMLQ